MRFPRWRRAAGRLLAAADGPRIAAMELGGWDTHAAQGQRLLGPLRQLDAGLVALKASLGEAWKRTAVLVTTEFGRTVHLNGTGGTDHGTGAAAFVAGGAVAGGRVLADWPGLAPGRLFEARDLQPTMDVRALAKGLLASYLRLPAASVSRAFRGARGWRRRGGCCAPEILPAPVPLARAVDAPVTASRLRRGAPRATGSVCADRLLR